MNTRKNMRLATVALATATVAFATFAETSETAPSPGAPAKAEAKSGAKYASLAEARAKIQDVIADPALMSEIIKTLSPEDQKTFLSDVNAAITKLPASAEEKAAKFLTVNRAALDGVAKEAKIDILAVTFATVPPASLTVISERYAVDLFNRGNVPAEKMPDPVYEKTAKDVVGKVEMATVGSDDAGVRNTLAIIMFLRASGGTPENLTDTLVNTMPEQTIRDLAKTEWIPAALANPASYEALLAYADGGLAPNIESVLALAGPTILDSLLLDITSGMDNAQGIQTTPILDQAFGGFDENTIYMHVDTTDPLHSPNALPAPKRPTPPTPVPPKPKPPEPKPYSYNTL